MPMAAASPTWVNAVRALRPRVRARDAPDQDEQQGEHRGRLDEHAEREDAPPRAAPRPRTRNANAPITESPTSTSLWPLATEWKTTTGLQANAAMPNAARDGQTRFVVSWMRAIVARVAATAMNLNA